MSKNKKPRKRYTRHKLQAKGTQNLRLEHRDSWGKEIRTRFAGAASQVYSDTPTEAVCRAAVNIPRRWYLEVIAHCVDHDGNPYQKAEVITTSPCLLDDLKDHYIATRDRVQATANPNHFQDMGWVARPLTPQLESQLQRAEAAA